jgi:hypothetical protein
MLQFINKQVQEEIFTFIEPQIKENIKLFKYLSHFTLDICLFVVSIDSNYLKYVPDYLLSDVLTSVEKLNNVLERKNEHAEILDYIESFDYNKENNDIKENNDVE